MGQRNSVTPAVLIVHTIIPAEKILEVLYTSKQCYNYIVEIRDTSETIKFTTELALSENIPYRIECRVITIIKLPCPDGFDMNSTSHSCVCNSLLQSYGFKCSIQEDLLFRPGNEWIGYYQDNAVGLVTHCPFDYCYDSRVVDVSIGYGFDSQCNYNRSKVLCGQCKESLSMMFGTSQCAVCSNTYLLLVVPFAVLGVALVALLFILNLTVISGTLNGIIFYANVFRVNDSIFIPVMNQTGISQVFVIIIAWFNLDFGIETCFYNGMDSIAKTWLQFVFPIYLLSLVSVVVLLGRYSTTMARIKAVPVVATLMQLSYSKLVRTIITIFSYLPINAPNSSVSHIWIYDGNVRLFEGAHLALFIFGLFVTIIFIIPYTFLLLLAPLLQSRSHWYGCH